MPNLTSVADFEQLQFRLMMTADNGIPTIVIPAGTCGQANGANDLIRVAKREIIARGLSDKLNLRITGCHGWCEMEPSALVEPQGYFYPKLAPADMARVVAAAAAHDVVEDLFYKDADTGRSLAKEGDIPFYQKQVRAVLGRNARVDPIRIYNYIENRGYAPWAAILGANDPANVIAGVRDSGLRGRGGAGFPTGKKWELLAKQPGDRGKFLVCNADEGDPGAYMDRSILEGNPHSVIEGMLIGAFATGATEGVIYVRAEYPLAIKHLLIALRQARELGLLGENILGSGFSFDINIVRGAGAFVCGEETALIASIEGRMGEPRQRPPYPIQKGIDGKPTVINNVETWANIPIIFAEGPEEFAKIGTPRSTGTKIFSLVGKVKNTGLVEVPMGITFDEIVYDIGGGAPGGAGVKAVQTGGPSGGCIPASEFFLPIDYDSLAQAGSIMGSGGMIVMDENTCMVDVARYFMNFLKDESCGKCFTCRKGTQRLYEILDDITKGLGKPEHLDLLEELALAVKDTTMCGLGQSAPNPVLSTLKYFRAEYERHIYDKRCDALVCKELTGAPCQATCPVGTEAWRYVALIEKGDYEGAYQAIREANPFPSVCARVCHHPCEEKCRAGTTGGQPVAIRALKRFVTDNVDPATYTPKRAAEKRAEKVAIVGAGPAGLAAAHYLSLAGYKSTVFEANDKPGGMLVSGIPAYRLNRDTLQKEIDALLDENVELKLNTALGRDVTVSGLFDAGYKAIFLATGAPKSRTLNIDGEDAAGVFPAMHYLREFNLHGRQPAAGRVGVIGGGNSAVDAARVARRQPGVTDVTIYYRRTRKEMTAYAEEIEGALEEGINLVTLVSPVEVVVEDGKVKGIKLIKNKLGEREGGRRKPVAIEGTEHVAYLDTLIVAVSDESDLEPIKGAGIEATRGGNVKVDAKTLATSREGVFAGGDLVTGPNSVVDAVAAGKRAAVTIMRYLRGEALTVPPRPVLPTIYVPASAAPESETAGARVVPPMAAATARVKGFAEIEQTLSAEAARCEARRCLRCDLEFTRKEGEEAEATPADATRV